MTIRLITSLSAVAMLACTARPAAHSRPVAGPPSDETRAEARSAPAVEPLIGRFENLERGDDLIPAILVDRGLDRERLPRSRELFGETMGLPGLRLIARAELSIPFREITLIGFERTCEARIARATEVHQEATPEAGESARRLIALLPTPCMPEDQRILMGVAGARVRVHRFDHFRSPLPAPIEAVVARSDRELTALVRQNDPDMLEAFGEDGPRPKAPRALLLDQRGLIVVRARYGNAMIFRGAQLVFDYPEFGANAIVEAGARMFLLLDGPNITHIIDVETRRELRPW